MKSSAGSYMFFGALLLLAIIRISSTQHQPPQEISLNNAFESAVPMEIGQDSHAAIGPQKRSRKANQSEHSLVIPKPSRGENFRRQVLAQKDNENYELDAILERLRLPDEDAFPVVQQLLLTIDTATPRDKKLRLALLDLMFRFNFPEVEDFALQLLGNDPEPLELSRLGLYLEKVQPGLYTDSIRAIAEQTLFELGNSSELPGEFFQLLGRVGGESSVSLLLETPIQMNAYSSVALALIADGSGLSLLEQDARLFEAGVDTNQGRLAIQLLAQEAFQQESAANALFELAGANLIPADLWPDISDFLAGAKEITLELPRGGLLATNTIYRPEGDQVLYTAATSPLQEPPDSIDQRIALVGQMQDLAPKEFQQHFILAETRLMRLRQQFSANELREEGP